MLVRRGRESIEARKTDDNEKRRGAILDDRNTLSDFRAMYFLADEITKNRSEVTVGTRQ